MWEIFALRVNGPEIVRVEIDGSGVIECDALRMVRNMASLAWKVPFSEVDTRVFRWTDDLCDDYGWGAPYDLPVPVVIPDMFA